MIRHAYERKRVVAFLYRNL